MYFENLQLLTQTKQAQEFIDPNRKPAMMGGAMDNKTAETNLHGTGKEAALEDLMNDDDPEDGSTLTGGIGSTRTSKAKQFTEEARKEIILQLQQQKVAHSEEIEKYKKENEE